MIPKPRQKVSHLRNKPRTRQLRLVDEEPFRSHGKARLFAFGFRAIANLSRASLITVKRAHLSGKLDCNSLESVIKWIEQQRHDRDARRVGTIQAH